MVDGEVAVVKGRVVDAQGKPVVNVGEFMIEPRQTFVQKRRGCLRKGTRVGELVALGEEVLAVLDGNSTKCSELHERSRRINS